MNDLEEYISDRQRWKKYRRKMLQLEADNDKESNNSQTGADTQ
jgi:hypothetical protein